MANNKFSKLNTLPYFTKNEIRTTTNISENTLKKVINRAIKAEEIIPIKRGLYTTNVYIQTLTDNTEKSKYFEFISSVIKEPSYLSLEYILSKNNLLTEPAQIYTAVTLKNTNNYENIFGSYKYRNIKKGLFKDYEQVYFRNAPYFIATPAKALFDYVYFNKSRLKKLLDKNIAKELRIKTEEISSEMWEEFNKYISDENSSILTKIGKNFLDNISK